MRPLITITFLASLTLLGCKSSEMKGPTTASSNHSDKYADLVLTNGKIYTLDPAQPWVSGVAVTKGKIVYRGDSPSDFAGEQTTIINLQGKLVLPGLHDTHLHPLEAGNDSVKCILDSETSLNQYLIEIEQCVASIEQDSWILGWGHSLETLLESNNSPVELLDQIETARPVAIMESTSHSVWVNSKALELAHINADSPNPQGGVILKDSNGQPNGILLDSAGEQIFDIAFRPTPELLARNYEGLLYGLSQVAKNGITSMVDARVYWQRGYLDAWQKALNEGRLTARTQLSLWAYPDMNDDEQLATLKSLYANPSDGLLKINQVKFYSDGIFHNTTAAVYNAYQTSLPGVSPFGLNYFTKQRLIRYITELEKAGFNMHIHAIGDRAVGEALDAIESAQMSNGDLPVRHKLTHVELVAPRDKPRFAELGVTADFQLAGDFTRPENHYWLEPQIGNRAYLMLPVRDLYNTGANITLSSDWDVSSLSPFVGMQNALSRGEQSLPDLDAVIRAYTINSAYAMGQENQTGSIEVGKFGDFTIVDQNLFEIGINKIAKTQVVMTILGGKVIYQANAQMNKSLKAGG